MKPSKYVIIDQITPVIFNAPLSHKDMVKLGPVTSAGYFLLDEGKVVLVGHAFTLAVPNGEHDGMLLERVLNDLSAVHG